MKTSTAILGLLLLSRGAWASWTTETPMPSARGGTRAGVVNGVLYLAGGFNGTDTPTLQAYDAAGNSWKTLASMPLDSNGHGRYAGESDVINGLLYVVGGWQTYSNLPTSSLYVYDPATNAWSTKASLPPRGPYNSPLSACGIAGAIQGKLYVTTACDGIDGYRAFLDVYDPATDTWAHKADSPHVHYAPAGGVIDGKLYVAGGSDASGTVAALDVYDPGTDTWVTRSPMLTPRSDAVGAVVGNKLFVIGGKTNGAYGSVVGTVEAYDPSTNLWASTADAMITARVSAAAGVVGSKIYVVGGNDASGAIVSTNEMYDAGAVAASIATPTVTILAPAAGATVAGFAAITSSVTGSIGSVAYTLDGSGYLDAVLITPPYAFYWDTTKVANGTHTLTAGGWDKLTGQWSAGSPPVVVTVNNPVPPPAIPVPAPVPVAASTSVVVLTPAYGSTLSTSVVLTAQVTGNVGCVAYTLDGSGYLDACLTTPPYSFTWDASAVVAGTHTITAGAWDKATGAFLVGSPPVVVGVPASAPIHVTSPNGGEDWPAGSTQTITWTGGAPAWPILIQVIDSAKWQVAETLTANAVNIGSHSWVVDMPAGTYQIYVQGDRGQPDSSWDYSHAFSVSTQAAAPSAAPAAANTVTILAPTAGATVSGFAAVTSSVTGSVGSVAYTLDGSGYLDAVLITPPYALYWDTTKVANGTHTLTAGGWDKLTGQWSAGSPPVIVTVNNPVPPPAIPVPAPVPVAASTSVVVLTPAYGSTLSASVVLTAQVTGNVGCVAYTLDGSGYLDACLTTPPYSFTWDASAVVAGTHTITAGAWDKSTGAFLVGSPPVVVGVPAPDRPLSMSCAVPRVVKQAGGGDCTTISACIPPPGTTLAADLCVSIEDSATYPEQVGVEGVNTAGFRLIIGADPALPPPVVRPPVGSTAAFLIANASVTIAGIDVTPAYAVPFGILVSSDDAVLSSVSLRDVAGWIRTAGVSLQGRSTLKGSTVAVQAAIALKLSGDNDAVGFSVISSSGLGVSANNYYDGTALVIGSSSNTVSDSYASNPLGNASYILGGASYNSISRSTFTSGGGWGAMLLQAARFNTVTRSYLSYFHDAGDAYNTITQSTMAGAYLDTSASDTITQCVIPGTLYMNLGSYNNVSQSDIGSLLLINSASNTVTRSFIDSGATIEDGSAWNTISYSTVASVVIGPNHAQATGASTTTILDSYVWGSPAVDVFASTGLVITGSTLAGARTGTALALGAGNTGVLTISSVSLRGSAFGMQLAAQAPGAVLAFSSVTFMALAPGATGVQFLGGTFVSTFTGAVFADSSIGADVDGRLLAAGSRVTMRDASGPRAGSLYEDDPRGLVDWVPDFLLPAGGVAAPTGSALGVSSIAWTWAAATNAVRYAVYAASTAAVLAQPAAPSFIETGLAPNTTASLMVAGVGGGGPGPLSPAATAFTLAQPPAGLTAFEVGATSAALAWSLNGNPAATAAELQRSTDAASFADVFLGAATGYADAGLLGCTTYTYRVRNVNWAGLPTAYAAPLAFETSATTPAAPAGFSAVSLDGARIQLAWTPSPTEGVVAYRLYYGTAAVDYSTPLMTLPPTATSTTTAALQSGVLYRFGLRALHRCGVEEPNTSVVASAPALVSASGTRAGIKIPASGKRIAGNSVLVMAELVSGDPAQTAQVLFQYRPSTAAAWADLPAADPQHPNPDRAFPYFVQWDVTSLSSGSYDLRAVATDVFGASDPAPGFITVVVDPVSPDLSVTDLGGGSRQTKQTVNAAAPNLVSAAEPATGLVSQVQLPAGALADSSATLTVTVKPPAAPPPAPGAQTVGSALEVQLSNGQTRLSGGQTATLVFTYPDSSGSGVVDGTTLRADRLEVRSYDPVSGTWRKESASVVDKKARTITATTPHFSFFQVFGTVAADLSGVRLYPNPYKPHGGDPDQGHAYSPSDPVSGIVFDDLPATAEIKIYTVTGKLVATLDAANGSGAVQWDVRNSDGQDVASGGYFAVVTSPGQSPVVMKLGVIR